MMRHLSELLTDVGPVSDKTLTELKEIDVGYRFTVEDGITFPYRGKSLEIPTLQEAFEQLPEIPFNIDIKNPQHSAVKNLVEIIKKFHRKDIVLVGSFHNEQIRRFRTALPCVPTAAAPSEVRRFLYATAFHLTRLVRPKYTAFQVPLTIQKGNDKSIDIVNDRFVCQAHNKGIAVMIWTINDPITMRQLIQNGIDGIFTDAPETLIGVLDEMQTAGEINSP